MGHTPKKYILSYPQRYMIPVLDKLPDLLICWRYKGDWYTVTSPNPLCKTMIHEFIMLEVHERFPVGERWVLIPNHEIIEPFTSDNWDECVVWCAKRYQTERDRLRFERCLQLEIK